MYIRYVMVSDFQYIISKWKKCCPPNRLNNFIIDHLLKDFNKKYTKIQSKQVFQD